MTATATAKAAGGTAPPLRWEHRACHLCGADETDLYHRERLAYFERQVEFRIVRCRRCGLVYTDPRLRDHNGPYLLASGADAGEIERHARAKRKVFERALGEIERRGGRAAGGRLLDVGCGTGHFLALARERGYEVLGLEPAAVPARYARDVLRLPVEPRDITGADFPAERFAVITAWDVIEHLADPREMLRRCVVWLRPGGVLALRFPSSTWQRLKAVLLHRLLRLDRPVFAPTIHLYFFDEQTFSRLARQAGLEVLRVRGTPLEPNADGPGLNALKRAGNLILEGVEGIGGRPLGNLEAYCRKVRA